MSTEIDPIRFTDSSSDAPELLRGAFAAGAKEGPSAAQMRILAVKLAAVSAGTAVAVTASTAHAGTTLGGGTVAATSTLSFSKIFVAIAMVGAGAVGGVVLLSKPEQTRMGTPSAEVARVHGRQESAASTAPKPVIVTPGVLEAAEPSTLAAAHEAEGVEAVIAPESATSRAPSVVAATAKPARTATVRNAEGAKAKPAVTSKVVSTTQEAHEASAKADVPSEVELLRRARTALASRPREAFTLTEQHREHYPRGVFAQERDALAIEALLRAGDTDAARRLAQSFISAHPSSPHAHRFRETLGLR